MCLFACFPHTVLSTEGVVCCEMLLADWEGLSFSSVDVFKEAWKAGGGDVL